MLTLNFSPCSPGRKAIRKLMPELPEDSRNPGVRWSSASFRGAGEPLSGCLNARNANPAPARMTARTTHLIFRDAADRIDFPLFRDWKRDARPAWLRLM